MAEKRKGKLNFNQGKGPDEEPYIAHCILMGNCSEEKIYLDERIPRVERGGRLNPYNTPYNNTREPQQCGGCPGNEIECPYGWECNYLRTGEQVTCGNQIYTMGICSYNPIIGTTDRLMDTTQ